MNKQETNKLVPILRFPEFRKDDEWSIAKLSEICNVFKGSSFSKAEINADGNEYCIHYGELFTKYDETIYKIISKTNKIDGFKSKIGDILMPSSDVTPTGLAKASTIMLENVLLGGDMNILRPKEEFNSVFLSYLINFSKNEIIKLVSGTTVKHIYPSQIINCPLVVTYSKKEQQKIANCLSSLDELITAQNQKIEALKKHKKGLMQNLFPADGETVPKMRFKEFGNYGYWEEKTLEQIATFLKGKGISKADISQDGVLPCIRYGELYTQYKETINSVISYTNLPKEELILSQANDVIIPASGETQEDIATASCVMINGIALGGDLNIIRTDVNGVFLSYFLNNAKKKEIAQLAQGISVVHLYSSQLKNLKINIPQPIEQKKIADCLSSLDNQIEAETKRLEELKNHKKGLMQQLFPTIHQ